jgi:trehalose 6-phosphate phosphatase
LERLVPPDPRDLHHIAVLLDVDGTLLDIAPTPQQVEVPQTLRQTLARVAERLGGAVALVSGRPLADLDLIFAPLRLAAIGGHGAEIRPRAGGRAIEERAAGLESGLTRDLRAIAARYPRVTVEDKGYSLALHYRAAPEAGPALVEEVRRACDAAAPNSVELLPGKAVIEIKPAGYDKGTAVRELMKHAPFAGRAPIFIGDDKTDEPAFAVVPQFNGRAISVGRTMPGAEDRFQSPADVREWLDRLGGNAAGSP